MSLAARSWFPLTARAEVDLLQIIHPRLDHGQRYRGQRRVTRMRSWESLMRGQQVYLVLTSTPIYLIWPRSARPTCSREFGVRMGGLTTTAVSRTLMDKIPVYFAIIEVCFRPIPQIATAARLQRVLGEHPAEQVAFNCAAVPPLRIHHSYPTFSCSH